jgi:transglutaminase-like putative cysteine protease
VIYDVTHVTAYAYGAPVTFARCTLRLTPLSGPGQVVLSSAVETEPAAATATERTCFFGNRIKVLTFDKPHTEARFIARARVDVKRAPPPPALPEETLAAVAADAIASHGLDPASPAHFLFPSPRAPQYAPAADYARVSFADRRPALDGARDLMRRIRADFKYDPDATKVSTPLSEAFVGRHGVCQDFAHIMIAGLRGLGLPAAYVSGYIRTIPPPGRPRLEGADATHAWVNVWCGRRIGWVGLDPTNAIPAGDDHIVLAIGRDYSDVSPVDGIIFGSREQEVEVSVDVIPVG